MNVYNYYKDYEKLTELFQSWKLNQCIFSCYWQFRFMELIMDHIYIPFRF